MLIKGFRLFLILLLIFSCGCNRKPTKWLIVAPSKVPFSQREELINVVNKTDSRNSIVCPLDSNEIAFIRYHLFTSRSEELWTIDRDGKNQIKVINKPYINNCFWSPDGTKLIFSIGRKKFNIWMIDMTVPTIKWGEEVLKEDYIKNHFSWFSNNIFTLEPSLKKLTKLKTYPIPSSSPDGKKIVFQFKEKGDWKIYLLDVVEGKKKRLTDTPTGVEERCPVWSPDGRWIAFEENNLTIKDVKKRRRICLINLETNKIRKLPPLPKPLFGIFSMCFSSDSKTLAFETSDYKNGKSNHEIYTIDIDGKNLKNLTNTPDWDESCPSWRPIVKK